MLCERCNKTTTVSNLSYMNLDNICPECVKVEKNHPLYESAKKIELEFVQRGFKSSEVERKKYHNYPGLFNGMKWTEIEGITKLSQLRELKQNKITI